jgi:hypothetical protein
VLIKPRLGRGMTFGRTVGGCRNRTSWMTAKLCIRLPDIAGDLTVNPQFRGLDFTHSRILRDAKQE